MQLAGVGAQAGPVLVEARWEAYPAWGYGIADHRFRYSPCCVPLPRRRRGCRDVVSDLDCCCHSRSAKS